MLRILQIYYEPALSGQTTHVLSLTKGLVKNGHSLTVVLPRTLAGYSAQFGSSVKVVPLSMRKLVWRPEAVLQLASIIRRGNFNVVHIHSQEAGLLARLIAKMAGAKRIVYTPQTIDIRQNRWQGLYERVERALAGITDRIISVNNSDRQRMLSWGISPEKVTAIPNGINLEPFDHLPDIRNFHDTIGVDSHVPLVIQVGRLSQQKNPFAFIEGAALVAREVLDSYFVMVGEGPLRKEVEDRVLNLPCRDRIRLVGQLEGAAMLLSAADIVTLTSLWEGTPYSLLEGMAWSKPVVATSVNGCNEIVEDGATGFLTPPGDIALWASFITRLLKDRAMAVEMGRQGRRRVESYFTIDKMVSKIENVYYDLLAGAQAGLNFTK
jgi:glycosyltransferase involved in cell wall biosynthesis